MKGTDIESNAPREREKRAKINVAYLLKVFLGVVITIVALVGVFIILKKNKAYYSDYEVIETIQRADGNTVVYASYGNNILKYSRDGASAINSEGNFIWSGSYEMTTPIVDVCKDYVVIGDQGNTQVKIYNQKGEVGSFSVLNPILQVEVASQGVVAILMEGEESSYYNLYSETGKLLTEVSMPLETSGFPIDMSLSSNGRILGASYLDVSTGVVEFNVDFRNFGDVGSNSHNGFAGAQIFSEVVIPKIEIINNKVCIYRNDGVSVYELEEQLGDLIFEVTYEQEIESIFYTESYLGFILDNEEGESRYILELYDFSGDKLLSYNLNFDYTTVQMSGSDIMLYSTTECMIINRKGKVKFQYEFSKPIEYMFFTSSQYKYFLVDGANVEIIKLKEGK